MKRIVKCFVLVLFVFGFGISLVACGETQPTLTLSNSTIINVEATPGAVENKIGQIVDPSFTTQGLQYFTVKVNDMQTNSNNIRLVIETDNSIQIIAKDKDNNYQNVTTSGWGPRAGFELKSEITTFYVRASKSGVFDLKAKLVDMNANNAVISEKTQKIIVAESF